MNFMISHQFDTLLANKSVRFRDFRVFRGALPSCARLSTPETFILQAFTIGFEVLDFVFSPCQKRRVSVLRRFGTGTLFVF